MTTVAAIPVGEFEAWDLSRSSDPDEREVLAARAAALREQGHLIAQSATVAALAVVGTGHLSLGEHSYLAAFTHVSGDVRLGSHCSVNVSTAVRGTVTTGDGVRIGANSAILGFDHGFDDPATPVYLQPLRSTGIVIGDDVWIGSHVVVRDGVRIGSHSVIGAGSVVTRDVPDWAVVVGNPARLVRSRLPGAASNGRSTRLAAFSAEFPATVERLIASAWDGTAFHDTPGAPATLRAHTDAIELADLAGGIAVPGGDAAWHAATLRATQDHTSGLVSEADTPAHPSPESLPDAAPAYHVLSVGYALQLLGSSFAHPVAAIADLPAGTLIRRLDSLEQTRDAWGVGATVDSVATALTWQLLAARDTNGLPEAITGWVLSRRDAGTGLWAPVTSGLRLPVNGAYRLVRGTLAAWGIQPGGQEALIDTVLRRSSEPDAERTACDALDVIHLLWWARAAVPGYRGAEIESVAQRILDGAMQAWQPGSGWAFARGGVPGLQGTEMWAAICWYAADIVGESASLGYRPRGVHRPEPWCEISQQRHDNPTRKENDDVTP